MQDSQSLPIDLLQIGPMFLEQPDQLVIAPEDSIVQASKPLIIFSIHPNSLPLIFQAHSRLVTALALPPFEFPNEILSHLIVIVIGGHMQNGRGILIDDILDLVDEMAGEQFCLAVLEMFDQRENLARAPERFAPDLLAIPHTIIKLS